MSHWRNGAILVCLSATVGCGAGAGDGLEARRAEADRYVRAAQAAMTDDAADLRAANDAYVAFSRGELTEDTAITKMRNAERTITGVRDRVIVLEPPAPVRALHTRLVHYLDLNHDLAVETRRLAAYTPAAEAALTPVRRINRRLSTQLERARDESSQARALRRFATAVDSVGDDLRALEPPPVLTPAHRDQLRRLDASHRLADQLRAALVKRDAARVATLLRRFRTVGRAGTGLHALQRQAQVRYDQRLDAVREAYVAVARETAHVQSALRAPSGR